MSRLVNCIVTALVIAIASESAVARVLTQAIAYRDGDVKLEGYLAWDGAIEARRPGVMVVHEWWGLNDYAKRRAEMLAELGYVAFAADMYGEGKVTEDPQVAGRWAGQLETGVRGWQQRALSGLEVLRDHTQVDNNRIAAIGYCFGGSTVMQMAYGEADIQGVVSLHGDLPLPGEAQPAIKPRILVAHGSADPFTTPARVTAFQTALDKADADWEMIFYGGAVHGFTNPAADTHGIAGLSYDPRADARSWRDMQVFLDEIFARAE